MAILVEGKFNTATIHSKVPQETAITQIEELMNQEFMEGTEIHIMPDYHAGAGCVIGTTIKLNGKVVPNLVGVDVGCGVMVWKLGSIDIDFEKLDNVIRERIPSGNEIHENPSALNIVLSVVNFNSKNFVAQGLDNERTAKSLGTAGGGNHFIELSEDSNGCKYLIVHTGSRYVGAKVAKYHQDKAISQLKKIDVKNLIETLKSEGRHKEIEAEIQKLKASIPDIPKELAYLEGKDFDSYINDMKLAQKYAVQNRRNIGVSIIHNMNWEILETFDTIHNYIDTEEMILRKGAVRALEGELLVVPINMADGTLLCVGKGNPDWNYSAPHGAGRIKSRKQAKNDLTMDDFTARMSDVWTSTAVEETLDEAPMAYKPIEEIMDAVVETVDVIDVLKPLYNFKGIENNHLIKK